MSLQTSGCHSHGQPWRKLRWGPWGPKPWKNKYLGADIHYLKMRTFTIVLGKATHPHPSKQSSLHKYFAQTLSACIPVIGKKRGQFVITAPKCFVQPVFLLGWVSFLGGFPLENCRGSKSSGQENWADATFHRLVLPSCESMSSGRALDSQSQNLSHRGGVSEVFPVLLRISWPALFVPWRGALQKKTVPTVLGAAHFYETWKFRICYESFFGVIPDLCRILPSRGQNYYKKALYKENALVQLYV